MNTKLGVVEYTIGLPISPAHEVELGTSDRTVTLPEYTFPGSELTAGDQVRRFIHDFLVGPFGTITMALSYAFAIVFPIVTIFFLVFSVLEDSGYFPRMAIMVNRSFRSMGLNGKAVLPMMLGLGCTTMATMTTRVLETKKERLVTTMLLALAVPCSAQLGVLLALMAALSPTGAIIWLGLMVGVVFLVGWLTARVFPGETGEFILEIPPMRKPQLGNVVTKTPEPARLVSPGGDPDLRSRHGSTVSARPIWRSRGDFPGRRAARQRLAWPPGGDVECVPGRVHAPGTSGLCIFSMPRCRRFRY